MSQSEIHTIHLFSHLPKTAGSTIRKTLSDNYEPGNSFFHFAVNGFKNLAKAEKSPYETYFNIERYSNDALILFGHKVDESLLHSRLHDNIVLSTILRHPFSRNVSQFYMRKNAARVSIRKSMNQFFSANKDFMCKFYAARFPTLVNDPFENLASQAISVLSHFKHVELLENAPESLDRIMHGFNLEYDKKYDTNQSTQNGYRKVVKLEEMKDNFYNFHRQDLELYYHFSSDSNGRETKPLPSTFLKPYLWLSYFVNILLNYNKTVNILFEAIKDEVIKDILRPQLTLKEINYETILVSLMNIENYEELHDNLKYNLFDLFNLALSRLDAIPAQPLSSRSNIFKQIMELMHRKMITAVIDLKDELVLGLPENDMITLLAKSKFYSSRGNQEMAFALLNKAVRIYPTDPEPFIELFDFALMSGDQNLSSQCVRKLIELNTPKAKRHLAKNKLSILEKA